MLNVENKVIAITGASSGIGEATAKLLAANGAKVVLGARRTDKLEKLVEEIQASGGIAAFKAVDVTDREDVKAFIGFAKDKFGRVDVIFNNAGVMPLSPGIIHFRREKSLSMSQARNRSALMREL